MLGLEDWMDIRSLHQPGLSVSEIARREGVDRKTGGNTFARYRVSIGASRSDGSDPLRVYLRVRWEQGVENASRLLGRERAFVRFETAPGEQVQMDWGHFGNWAGRRLYGFILTLCWSDAVRGVHATAGHRDEAQLHDPRLSLLRRDDGNGVDREHEDLGGQSC
jgi:hypothetical protein